MTIDKFDYLFWDHFASNLLDDIEVTEKTIRKLKKLIEIFDKLEKIGFHLKLDTCGFFNENINYLGHKGSNSGLKKHNKKIYRARDTLMKLSFLRE